MEYFSNTQRRLKRATATGNAGISFVLTITCAAWLAWMGSGEVPLEFAAVLKKRLLEGTFAIDESEVRRAGIGALVARLNEAGIVEQTSAAALFGILSPLLQLVIALVLFAKGVIPALLVPLLIVFAAGAVTLALRLGQRHAASYLARMSLTEDLVDKIIGHRTRAVQDHAPLWHQTEDEALDGYVGLSELQDRVASLSSVYPRIWLSVAALALLGAFVFRPKPKIYLHLARPCI